MPHELPANDPLLHALGQLPVWARYLAGELSSTGSAKVENIGPMA
jgi:hypothetical protein